MELHAILGHKLTRSNAAIVLGSHDIRVAEWAAQLYLDGLTPYLLFSGGFGNLTRGSFSQPEADIFADIARRRCVPSDSILIENKSTNTGENIQFSYEVLLQSGVSMDRLILVQKPYMERRTYATFIKQWPGDKANFSVTVDLHVQQVSPLASSKEYMQCREE